MSHHDTAPNNDISDEERDANSTADTIALLSLVIIAVVLAVFYVS